MLSVESCTWLLDVETWKDFRLHSHVCRFVAVPARPDRERTKGCFVNFVSVLFHVVL